MQLYKVTTPPDLYPSVWPTYKDGLDWSRVCSPQQVLEELKDEYLHNFVKGLPNVIVVSGADVQKNVTTITDAFPNLVDEQTGANFADPWIAAMAMAGNLTLVTEERKLTKDGRPQLRKVCEHFKIPYTETIPFLRAVAFQH